MWFEDRRVLQKVAGLVAVVVMMAALLSACQTSQGPSADELAAAIPRGFEAAGFKQDETLRVRFQPPIGNSKPVRAALAENVSLELVIFNLDPATGEAYGQALAPALATSAATVSFADGIYSASWDVRQTANAASGPYVRVEIRPAGVPHTQVCNDPWGACLGYLDARIVTTAGPLSGAAAVTSTDSAAAATKHSNSVTVPDHATLRVNFKVLAGTASVPAAATALVSLSGAGDTFDEESGNCSSNDFSLPGQGLQAVGAGLQAVGAGLQAVGAVGGLFIAEPALTVGRVTTPTTVAGQLVGHATPDYYGADVAILVVDDFGGNRYDLPPILLNGADIAHTELQDLLVDGSLSHGALVYHQLKQLAQAATGDDTSYPGTPNAPSAKYHAAAGPRLLIKAVSSTGLNTDDLATVIRAAVTDLPSDYQHVVVNMSFAIVPCAVIDDVATTIGTGNIPSFEAYVASLLQVNAIAPQQLDELGRLTAAPLELGADPFFAYLACPLPSVAGGTQRCDGKTDGSGPIVTSMVHVAASGNFGNEYALYPAALPTVISVGALDAAGSGYSSERSGFSNAATVLAPGALYRLADTQSQQLVYAGTSFAAPVVSLFAALDQMSGSPLCDDGSLAGLPMSGHALATMDLLNQPLLSSFLGSPPDAVSELCY